MAAKMSLKKVNLRSLNFYRDYSYPLTLSNSPEVVIDIFVFVAVASSDLKVPVASYAAVVCVVSNVLPHRRSVM